MPTNSMLTISENNCETIAETIGRLNNPVTRRLLAQDQSVCVVMCTFAMLRKCCRLAAISEKGVISNAYLAKVLYLLG